MYCKSEDNKSSRKKGVFENKSGVKEAKANLQRGIIEKKYLKI